MDVDVERLEVIAARAYRSSASDWARYLLLEWLQCDRGVQACSSELVVSEVMVA